MHISYTRVRKIRQHHHHTTTVVIVTVCFFLLPCCRVERKQICITNEKCQLLLVTNAHTHIYKENKPSHFGSCINRFANKSRTKTADDKNIIIILNLIVCRMMHYELNKIQNERERNRVSHHIYKLCLVRILVSYISPSHRHASQ